jgi:hypothetical protein
LESNLRGGYLSISYFNKHKLCSKILFGDDAEMLSKDNMRVAGTSVISISCFIYFLFLSKKSISWERRLHINENANTSTLLKDTFGRGF